MDKEEFCTLIKEYEKQLYVVAYTILNNESDSEDAVCSAIQKGYEKLEQLKNPKKFKAWIIRITKNEALQMKRKRVELPGNEKLDILLEATGDSYNELWDVLISLPEEYRIVIVMYYYNGMPIKEIADALMIPVGTVKSRMNRGKRLLKEALESGR